MGLCCGDGGHGGRHVRSVAGAVALSSKLGAHEVAPEIRYSMNPKPPKNGPHTGSLDTFIQQLKPKGEVPLSFLQPAHTDLAAWKARGRAKMLELMHYTPEACAPQAEVLSRQDCGDYVREEIRFNTTPVFRVPGTVLIPKGLTKPAPAVVLLHSHAAYYLWGRERELEGPEVHPTLHEMRETYGTLFVISHGSKQLPDLIAAECNERGVRINIRYWFKL